MDKVGTWIEDLTSRDEWTVWWVISELNPKIELVVIEEPVREVKYPVMMDKVGTWIEDLT